MKKVVKYFYILLFITCLFSYKDTHAADMIYMNVCSTCDYRDLDQIFSNIEQHGTENNIYYVSLEQSGTFSISKDYQIKSPIAIYGDALGNITINGNNHTITSINNISIASVKGDDDLTINDINFISKGFLGSLNNHDFIMLNGSRIILNHVSVIEENRSALNKDGYSGLSLNAYSAISISNTTISNFLYGLNLYKYGDATAGNLIPVEIDSCNLFDNVFSFYANNVDLNVNNSKLSSIEGQYSNFDLKESNDYGNIPIKRIDLNLNDFNSPEEENEFYDVLYSDSFNHLHLYLVDNYDKDSSTCNFQLKVKKNNTINISSIKEAALTDYFVNIDSDNLSNYTFSVSDSDIARIENGKIIFLKVGEVDVNAVNSSNEENYVVHLKLESHVNPKTINSIYISFVIVLFMIGTAITFYLRKRND